jgi:hypothetical protein
MIGKPNLRTRLYHEIGVAQFGLRTIGALCASSKERYRRKHSEHDRRCFCSGSLGNRFREIRSEYISGAGQSIRWGFGKSVTKCCRAKLTRSSMEPSESVPEYPLSVKFSGMSSFIPFSLRCASVPVLNKGADQRNAPTYFPNS